MTDDEMKQWIDNASYEALLGKWRLATGSLFFQGEIGDYYIEAMRRKRVEVGDTEHTRASKAIGWG